MSTVSAGPPAQSSKLVALHSSTLLDSFLAQRWHNHRWRGDGVGLLLAPIRVFVYPCTVYRVPLRLRELSAECTVMQGPAPHRLASLGFQGPFFTPLRTPPFARSSPFLPLLKKGKNTLRHFPQFGKCTKSNSPALCRPSIMFLFNETRPQSCTDTR